MRINVINSNQRYWSRIKRKVHQIIYTSEGKRKPAFKLALIFSIVIFLFSFVNFTAGVIAQRNYAVSTMLFKPLILDNYDILVRKFYSLFVQPNILYLDIKYKDLQKLEFLRQESLSAGTTEGNRDWVKVKVSNEGRTLKAKMRLKGGMADEHVEGTKWSFRVNIKGENTLFGMKEFAVMSPMRRNLIGEWFIRKVFEKEGLIARKYEFVEVVINGKSKGIYVIDERYDNVMLERNHRKEGPVIKIDQTPIFMDKIQLNPSERDNYHLSMDITAFNLNNFLQDKQLKKMFLKAKELMERFRLGLLTTSQIFDIEKLAKWTAIGDVMGAWHGFAFSNMRFYFNPVTSKFEPVPDDNYNERAFNYSAEFRIFRLNDFYNKGKFLKQIFSDYLFTETYLRELERVTQRSYLDQLFNEFNDEIRNYSYILANDYPFYNFLLESKGYTYDNAKLLRNILNPYKGVQAYFHKKDNKSIVLKIANNKSIPMEILYLKNNNEIIKAKSNKKLILAERNYGAPITYTEFIFEFHKTAKLNFEILQEYKLVYRLLGTSKIRTTDVFQYPAFDKNIISDNIQIKDSNYQNYDFLSYLPESNEIVFKSGNWTIDNDLIIPNDHTLITKSGTNIDLVNSAMILTYSPIVFLGLENYPVNILSSDSTGQGITVIKSVGKSLLKYVNFRNLSAPNRPEWELTGAINFYESPVYMYETHFKGNIAGDDYINLIRSEFFIDHSSISNSFADALDVDFCNGKIMESMFSNCGINSGNGDCLDFSGSIIDINNIVVDGASDKGISVGEETSIMIKQSIITDAKTAIASKDKSIVTLADISIKNSQTGIAAYQKKPEFGPAVINATNLMMTGTDVPYMIEIGSNVSVDGEMLDSKYKNVISLLN